MTPTTPTWMARRIASAAALIVIAGAALPATATAADRLIVGFDRDQTVAQQVADLRAAGAKVTADDVRASDIPALDVATVVLPEGAGPEVRAELLEDPDVRFVERDHVARASWMPGDPGLSQQWGIGRVGGYTAWDTSTGSGVKIAIVDTGVSYIHPDLWGKVDRGWDFVDGDADPMDVQGHGTHVAGIAAAIAGNSTGGAGLAPSARVLAVRVLDSEGAGYYSWIAGGIVHAADQGAKVINLSLGGPSGSAALESAVNYASAKGAVVTCATGNDGAAAIGYPARYSNCLAVGSSTSSDTRSGFSNYGPGTDVLAPGSNIYSSTRGGGYESWSGTSMATPFASGVAALLLSQGLSRSQVLATITGTARDLGPAGYDGVHGHGRIDAAAAVARGSTLERPPADSTAPVVASPTVGGRYLRSTTRTSYRWRISRATAWRVVGRTSYYGADSWQRTTARTATRRRIVQFRARSGVVRRRVVYMRRVAVRRVTSTAYRDVVVTASDNTAVDRVALQLDGRWVAIDFAAADGWRFAWRCLPGTHTFSVHAYDAANNTARQAVTQLISC